MTWITQTTVSIKHWTQHYSGYNNVLKNINLWPTDSSVYLDQHSRWEQSILLWGRLHKTWSGYCAAKENVLLSTEFIVHQMERIQAYKTSPGESNWCLITNSRINKTWKHFIPEKYNSDAVLIYAWVSYHTGYTSLMNKTKLTNIYSIVYSIFFLEGKQNTYICMY